MKKLLQKPTSKKVCVLGQTQLFSFLKMRNLLVIFVLFLPALAGAASENSELNLVFPQKILTLNFRAQPELLQQVPTHFVQIGTQKFAADFDGVLPESDSIIQVHSQFETRVHEDHLQEFFESISILEPEKSQKVEIRIDEKGEIIFEGSPQNGYVIETEKLIPLMNAALKTKKKYVRVPAKKVFSEVIVHPDLKKRGIERVIGIGQSNFAGSSDARRQNILAAAEKFNGQIIEKGRRFSFNNILEKVDEASGFVRELVIKGNETKKELGGGVCQVSTTAFRAAFSGGLPIVARRNHSYAVPYYKPFGLDAAIYLGALDLRFLNDTPGDILLQTILEDDNLFFVFYGTDDGREVEMQGPFISQYRKAPETIIFETEDIPAGEIEEISEAHDGFQAHWVRQIRWPDDSSQTQEFVSNYRPWPRKILKGVKKDEKSF